MIISEVEQKYLNQMYMILDNLKEKGIDIIHNYDNKRKGRQIKIINLQKISLLSSYRSSSDDEGNNVIENYSFYELDKTNEKEKEDINHNNLINNNSISIDGLNVETNNRNKDEKDLSGSKELTELTNKGPNYNNIIEQNIHEIADRMYSGSDTWKCKNCNERGDRWYIINHLPTCKNNKKQ